MNSDRKSTKTGTILIVDDTPDNLRFLSKMLADSGYDVKRAINGKMALMGVNTAPPDLILLDIMMPDMTGYEVCQQLKASEQTRQIPVIFLSALNEALDKVKAFEVGAVDYISKPFQLEEVLARVENHLTIKLLQNQLQEQNARLQVSEAKNLALLDAIPDLMFRVSGSGIFLDYRSEVRDKEELGDAKGFAELQFHKNRYGKKVEDVWDRDLAVWTMHYVKETLSTGKMQVGEYVWRVGDRWRHYEARYVISGEDEVLGILRDISDRKQAEADLRKSEAVLTAKNQELEKTLAELKRTQGQLVQNAKMVSLGQLVAGIAHEINNPTNFIYGNLSHVAQYSEDLLELIALYQKALPEAPPPIQSLVEELDLEFLQEDLQKLMDSMKAGSERISAIVTALRNFSGLGEAELKPVDIHQGIESTLMILQHRLRRFSPTVFLCQISPPEEEIHRSANPGDREKCQEIAVSAIASGNEERQLLWEHTVPVMSDREAKDLEATSEKSLEAMAIEVVKEYGELPLVECYPKEINQVFLHILSNAIDAFESSFVIDFPLSEGKSARKKDVVGLENDNRSSKMTFPTITIRTQLLEDKRVAIAISDNGPGMTEAVKERVFDPFFTTKQVGSGTGLGMSISYQIVVEKHNGELRCETASDRGTTFIIEIPIAHN